jgi:predicted  nucleic acid-binding Zn-ribbon protein
LREQLKLLEELQRHDARLQELEGQMKALPLKLAAAENAILELEKLLAREQSERQDTESFRKAQEDEQHEAEQQLSRAKAKLAQVKNLRESNAVQRELENTRKLIDGRDEEVQKLAAVLGQQKDKISEHEAKLSAERGELESQRQLISQRVTEIQSQVEAARASREETAKLVRPDVLRKYGTIRMKRGMAVVAVKDGTCRGCNMNIPPQLYNVLQRGSSLEICPNCNRIIYWAKLLEEASA